MKWIKSGSVSNEWKKKKLNEINKINWSKKWDVKKNQEGEKRGKELTIKRGKNEKKNG